jgi:hypothetical protein
VHDHVEIDAQAVGAHNRRAPLQLFPVSEAGRFAEELVFTA